MSVFGWNAYESGPLAAGPMIGERDAATARIWVQSRSQSLLTLRLHSADVNDAEAVIFAVEQTPQLDDWLCVVFVVSNLEPGRAYQYSFQNTEGVSPLFPLCPGVAEGASQIRIAFGSCYKYYSQVLPVFDAICAADPELFLLLGDTCYSEEEDRSSEASFMQMHLRNRNNDNLRRLIAKTSTLGIWDDHDYGPNDSDGSYREKERSLRCFRRMWAQRQYGAEGNSQEGSGIYSKVSAGPVDLFLLDSRFHRQERHCILGEAQLQWLIQGLRTSQAPVKLLLSGSQLLPEVAARSGWDWECFRRDGQAELAQLQRVLAEENISGVVALSGDPHLGQLFHCAGVLRSDGQRGPELWELTSSPIANRPWTHPVWPADSASGSEHALDRYLLEEVAAANFGMVDVDLNRSGAEIRVSLRDTVGNPFFSYDISLDRLRAQPARSRMAIAVRDTEHAYCFAGDSYARYELKTAAIGKGYPRLISDGWKGVHHELAPDLRGHLTALFSSHGKVFFFLGNSYVRFDLERNQVDPGYPKYIKRHWRGLWAADIDAILQVAPGTAYFIKGTQCIRYDLHADRAEAGYPRPLAEEFPGLAEFIGNEGVDAAVAWPDGGYYFIRNQQVLRYEPQTKQVSAGYPRQLSDGWFGFVGQES